MTNEVSIFIEINFAEFVIKKLDIGYWIISPLSKEVRGISGIMIVGYIVSIGPWSCGAGIKTFSLLSSRNFF